MLTVIQDGETPAVAAYVANKNRIIKQVKNHLKEEWDIVGGLSITSKMPGFSIGLPANACLVGSELAKVEGSVCEECYAKRGHYSYDNVQNALYRRLHSLNHPLWVPSLVTLIKHSCKLIDENFFRFHDSGDLMGVWHLKNIALVAELTPRIKYWIPTREYKMIRDYHKEYGNFPKNLIVRASAHMIEGNSPKYFAYTSTVSRKHEPINKESGILCQAYTRDNNCGDCRACWSDKVFDVTYHKH